jgi:sugar lactone lactonase YvrE
MNTGRGWLAIALAGLLVACSSAAPVTPGSSAALVPVASPASASPSQAGAVTPAVPTAVPTATAAAAPSNGPLPTVAPTLAPSAVPTLAATPTVARTATPEPLPTVAPTIAPTTEPTTEPTAQPTAEPSPTAPPAAVTVLAGGGTDDPGNEGPATSALLRHPTGIAVGPDGTVWIVDSNSDRLRAVTPDGIIHTRAQGFDGASGVAVADDGTAYVADRGGYIVVKVGARGKLVVVAGMQYKAGFSGDRGAAKRARLSQPYDVATDAAGNIYIVDSSNQRIRFVDARTLKISTIVGNGTRAFAGDGGLAKNASLDSPQTIAVDPAGTVMYIGDYGNARLRRVDLITGIITTVAGTGSGYGPYDPAKTGVETAVNRIIAVAMDAAGNAYMPVFYNDLGTTIMRLDPAGTLTRVAGGGRAGSTSTAPWEIVLSAVDCLEIDPFTGALLICQQQGTILAVPEVAEPAGQ